MANPWVKLTGIQKRAAQKLRVAGGSSFYDEVALQLRVMGYGNCNPDKIESEMTKLGIEAGSSPEDAADEMQAMIQRGEEVDLWGVGMDAGKRVAFQNGDRVKLTKEYQEKPGEVFTLSEWDDGVGRGWVGDEQGRGWYVREYQIELADDDGADQYDDDDAKDASRQAQADDEDEFEGSGPSGDDQIIELYEKGMSAPEIAAQLHIDGNVPYVRDVINKYERGQTPDPGWSEASRRAQKRTFPGWTPDEFDEYAIEVSKFVKTKSGEPAVGVGWVKKMLLDNMEPEKEWPAKYAADEILRLVDLGAGGVQLEKGEGWNETSRKAQLSEADAGEEVAITVGGKYDEINTDSVGFGQVDVPAGTKGKLVDVEGEDSLVILNGGVWVNVPASAVKRAQKGDFATSEDWADEASAEETERQAVELMREGKSDDEIAATLKIDVGMVREILEPYADFDRRGGRAGHWGAMARRAQSMAYPLGFQKGTAEAAFDVESGIFGSEVEDLTRGDLMERAMAFAYVLRGGKTDEDLDAFQSGFVDGYIEKVESLGRKIKGSKRAEKTKMECSQCGEVFSVDYEKSDRANCPACNSPDVDKVKTARRADLKGYSEGEPCPVCKDVLGSDKPLRVVRGKALGLVNRADEEFATCEWCGWDTTQTLK